MIAFRTDGNSTVGLGHVMRCLSIADAFKDAGESCLFVSADNDLQKTIEDRGFKSLVLGTAFDRMENELETFKKRIVVGDVDVLFVDSYYVTEKYLCELRQFCSSNRILLVYIDDVLAFPYSCDVLLNYNIFACEDNYRQLYKGYPGPTYLLNTTYAPQRKEFLDLPDRMLKENAKDILISTGGADFEHIGLEIIKGIIAHGEWKNYRFHFIVGILNEDRNRIKGLIKGQTNIFFYERVKNMARLMQSCDVAISAAGSTLYELCSTQTPTITYILADNQIPGAKGFEDKGVLRCVGDIRELGKVGLAEKALAEAVALCNDKKRQHVIIRKMKTIVDGRGAERIAQEIIGMISTR